MSKRLRNIT